MTTFTTVPRIAALADYLACGGGWIEPLDAESGNEDSAFSSLACFEEEADDQDGLKLYFFDPSSFAAVLTALQMQDLPVFFVGRGIASY